MYLRFQRLHEQSLRGGKRKKSLQLRLWNLNICIEKNRLEMLIGGYDISNDVITLGSCFSMFVYIRTRFCFALIGGDLTAQSTGSHRGIGDYSNSRDVVASSPSFFRSTARLPRKACSQANVKSQLIPYLNSITSELSNLLSPRNALFTFKEE